MLEGLLKKKLCAWCGDKIEGKPMGPFRESEMEFGPGVPESEPVFVDYYFCSEGCSWAFQAVNEVLYGESEAEVNRHLRELHGLKYAPVTRPPGLECHSHFEAKRAKMADFMMRWRIARRAEETIGRRFSES